MNPGIANLNGKRYIVPHWIEIDSQVGLDDIPSYIPAEKRFVKPIFETFPVPNRDYVITVGPSRTTCSCPGFTYRGKCKHMTAFKESK